MPRISGESLVFMGFMGCTMSSALDAGLKLRRILYPTDFSAASRVALPHAAGLARGSGALLYVVHVITVQPWELCPELSLQGRIEATRLLDQTRQMPELAGVRTEAVLRHGGVSAQVLRLAQEHSVDLVVMGTRAQRGLDYLLLGSAAEKLARSAPCPVLTIGPRAPRIATGDTGFRNIVLATNVSPGAAAGIAYACSFARRFGANLWVTHSDESLQARAWLKKQLPEQPGIYCVADAGPLKEIAVKVAEQESADLVMLGPGLASLEPYVARHAPCPVLTVRYAVTTIRPKTFGAQAPLTSSQK
jgi:nucleotide-binding universal stress UspA family protein